MKQTVERQARGLYPQWNPIDAPVGALIEAENCVIDREGIISKRRGFARYGSVLSGAAELFEYKDRLLVRQSNGTLNYDSDGAGTWTAYSGTFDGPGSRRIRAAQARRTLYLTTDEGIKSTDALTTSPTLAGLERGLDVQATVSGTGGSWFTEDTQVAYRVVFVRVDANKREITGAPSPREVINNDKVEGLSWTKSGTTVTVTHNSHPYSNGDTLWVSNSSDTAAIANGAHTISNVMANSYDITVAAGGGASGTLDIGKRQDVSLNFVLPDDIAAGDFYEIYKTSLSASASTDPGDDMRRVIRNEVAAGDVTAGEITYVDTFSTDFLEDPLYTNSAQEGATAENGRHPLSVDMANFKGHLLMANTKQRHFREIQFIDSSGLTTGTSSIQLSVGATNEIYTFETAEDSSMKEFQLFTSLTTEAENLEATMKSLARIINRASAEWYAVYNSGADDAPGKILIFRRTWADTAWTIICDAGTTGDNFSPELPTSGSSVESDNDAAQNRLYRAKFEQPDHVPALNFDDVGSADDPIQRILALKDVLVILKQDDGAFILTGETERDFVIKQAAPSVRILAPESAAVLDNAVYCNTTQGVLRIPETGEAEVVSRPIEVDLKRRFPLTNFDTIAHGASYESDRKFFLATPDEAGDTTATKTWVWDYLTRTWCRWDKPVAAYHVLTADDTLYGIHADDGFVLQERKSFGRNRADYQDEDISITVTAVSTTTDSSGKTVSSLTVTYSYSGHDVTLAGGVFTQGTLTAKVESVTQVAGTSYTFVLRENLSTVTTGAATYTLPISSTVTWQSESVGNPATTKKWLECQVYLEATLSSNNRLGFRTDEQPAREFVGALRVNPTSGWGSGAWGTAPWGDSADTRSIPLRTDLPRSKMRSRSITVTYQHRIARESFDITQMSLVYLAGGRRTTMAPRSAG